MAHNLSKQNADSILKNKEVKALLHDIVIPEKTVTEWIASLQLLQHIPFNNLVSDVRLLPKESIRFFYVDPSWTNCLVDGALSIGNGTTLDRLFTSTMSDAIKVIGSKEAQSLREGLEPILSPTEVYKPVAQAGILLRSELVTSWPALTLVATYADPQPASTDPIRFENIGAGIILCIFPAVPIKIELRQPGQGLEFGVFDNLTVYFRGLGTGDHAAGKQIPDAKYVFSENEDKFYRAGGKQVLNIASIKEVVANQLANVSALEGAIGPADFAMQMVKTPAKTTFDPSKPTTNK